MSNQIIFYIMGGSVAVLVVIILIYYILSKKMQKSEYKQIKKLQQGTKEQTFSLEIIYQKLYLENKKVGLFCLGGHGRTGYVACGVLGKLGYADPIAQIRKVYCNSAVESNSQIKQIAKYCNAPSLETKYYVDEFQGFGRGYMNWRYGSDYSYYDDYDNYDNYSPSITPIHGSLKNDKKEGDKLKDEEYWDEDGIEDPEILQMEILKMEEQERREKKSFGNSYTNPYRISK